ncbi:MAG: HAD family hydrolase [Candidatus Eremiobacteraeota bacterium]|nr:HAD family hydrolase [Candidatus Eremiobacteraeota bacterium]
MERISGIGFDLDHTLAIDNTLERVAFLRLLEALLAGGGATYRSMAEELDAIDDLLSHQRHGAFSIDEAVRRFVAAHGVAARDGHVETFRHTALSLVDDLVVPLPGVPQALQALSDLGIPTAVLTNGWSPMQARKARRAGFNGPVLVSSEMGVQKPAPAAFEMLLHALGTPRESSWYVGDDPQSDVGGAHAVGMRAVWMDWEGRTFPSEIAPAEFTIHRFSDVLTIVSAPVSPA